MIKDLSEEGAQPSQVTCLRMLTDRDGICQREIADAMRISRARVTAIVQALEKAGRRPPRARQRRCAPHPGVRHRHRPGDRPAEGSHPRGPHERDLRRHGPGLPDGPLPAPGRPDGADPEGPSLQRAAGQSRGIGPPLDTCASPLPECVERALYLADGGIGGSPGGTPRKRTARMATGIAGKVAVVTGGASGIGRVTALALAAEGRQGGHRHRRGAWPPPSRWSQEIEVLGRRGDLRPVRRHRRGPGGGHGGRGRRPLRLARLRLQQRRRRARTGSPSRSAR